MNGNAMLYSTYKYISYRGVPVPGHDWTRGRDRGNCYFFSFELNFYGL